MSIAKKSVKWLVALFVIFALILTASVALGNVARASAEPEEAAEDTEIALSVIAKGAVTGEAYPDLLSSTSARTVTVEYYFDIPAAIENDLNTEMKFDIYMTLPDNSTVKPTNIELNTAVASAVTMDALTNAAEEGYLDDAATAATEFGITLKTGHTMSELRGFTKSGTTYTLSNYFFKATYTVPASTNGVYSFGFGETSEVPANEALESEDAIIYVPEVTNVTTDTVMDGIDDVTAVSTGIFYVRSYIDVPVAVSGLIFNAQQQTAIVDKDGYAFVIGDLVNDIYPVFYHDGWPTGFSLVPETYIGGVEAQQSSGTFALIDKDITIWRIPDGNDGYTYSTDNYTVNWEIAKRSITAPVSAGTTYTYNGQAQSFEFSEDPLTDADYITITGTPQTNVGEYTVTAALTYPASTYWAGDATDVADKTYDFVINPALITVPTPANETYTYNGQSQSFQWASTPDALITITGTPQTAAGEYTITASIPANYAWNDEGHTTADKTFPFVIAKMQIDIPEEDDTEFVYTGSAQNYTVAASDYYTVTGTPQTNAGEYEVTISLDDTDNTEWSDGTTEDIVYDFVIAKVQITKPTPLDGVQYVYDSYNKQFMLDVVSAETGYYTISNNIRRNAGTQTVTVTLKDKTNTQWADGTTANLEFTFTVQPRPVNLSVSADAASHVYGDTPANVSISATGIIDAFTCSYKVVCVDGEAPYAEYTPTQFNEGLNAGHYTLNPVYNDINGNYDVTVSEPFSYEITKKQVSIPKAVSGLTFNGSEQEGVVNDDNSSLYDLGDWDMDDFNLASGSAKGTAAGNYTATFALEDTDNTEWANAEAGEEITNKTIAWYIDYLLVTKPTATTTTYYYSGSEKTYAFASAGDSNRYTVANNKRTNAGTQTVTVSLSNANYKWADGTTANLEFTFIIKKASVIAAPCSLDNTFTYTGEEITCNFISEGQQSYFTITGHKQTNVGTYDVTETLNDPNNYKWSHFPNVSDDEPTAPYVQENAFEITKKAVTIPTAISGLEYTGSAQVGVIKTDGSFYTLYSGSDEETAVGNYSATYRLKSTTNSYWVGDGTDVADKTVLWSIAKKSITKPSISASIKIYNGTSQSYSGSGTGYTFTGSGTNVGEYPVTVTLTDKANSVWAGTDSAEDYSEADKLVINKKTVKLTLTESADSSVYGNSIATITAGINPDYAPINTADIGTVSYTAKNFQTNVVYTKADFETIHTAPVGSYILTAVCSVDNDNYSIDAQTLPYAITIRYITVPTVVDDTFDYDGNEHSIGFSNVDNDYVDITYDTQSAIGVYTDTTTVALKAAFAGNIAWDDDNHTTAAKTYTLTIEVVEVNFTIVPIFNNTQKTGTAATQIVLSALPEATTYRWFKFTGYTFDDDAVSNVSLDMEGETVYANYSYNVGAGDADGDGVISSADVILLKRWNVGLDRAKKIADAATAWAKTDDTSVTSAVLYTALDANNNGAIRSNDVVAVREALATGRTYKVIVAGGIVKVAKANRVTVNSYEDLLGNIRLGNPVALGSDIDAANEIFNEDSLIPVDIDLGDHRLTVKGFTLNTAIAGATLKINNGTLYTVTGIAVTAPNGNVIVDDVNGYSYDGTVVNLSAYSESLHIASDVAFYIYKAQDPVTNEDYADVHAFVADVYPEEETVETIAEVVATIKTLANTRMGETEARMQDIATIKADTTKTEAQKAEDINALDVKKAIIEVPVDTHVVVEEEASLSVDKLVVKAQSDENAPAVTTFAIEVKNAAAEVVTVDISEVKETIETVDYYVVEEVAISGASSQVEIVTGDNTAADVKKYVAQIGTTSYETLQAAINAAQNADTIKLIADVADGTGIAIPDTVTKTITIDFGGKTYTVVGPSVGSTGTETQAMHWSNGSTVTLKNGTFVVSVQAATVPGSNGKIVKMAMQNYANLTVKNMTMDFSNIVVRNYGTYTGKDAPYSGLEIPLFNLNAGSMTIENTTITMPNDSTKGVLIEIPDAATIKNSTINGYVSLGQLTSNVTIVDSTVSGVVSYFAGYGVKHSGNVYRLGGVSVTNATELQAALDAGAIIIDIENDFNAPNPIAVSKSTIINGYDHTITSNGNRIMNVTDAGVVLTINDLTMTSATSERGLNIWDSATDTDITLNNVTIDAHLYAINYVNGADNETLTINNSSITGWAAINAHCNNSTFTVTDSTLYGINRNCDSQYGFSTVVIDGDSLHGSQEGDHGVDNTFVFDGCTIIAEVTLTHQYWISFQYAATGNVASVVVNNCEILDAPNGNDKSADMQINGTNNAVVMALSAEQYALVAAKHFNITDNGNGTYTIMPKTANISYFGTPYNFYDVFENGWLEDTEAFTLTDDVVLDTDVVFARNRAAAIAVSGGTFEMNLDGNTISGVGKILLPVGVTCVTDSNVSIAGIFEAPEGEVIIESVDADGNYIYAVGVAYVKTEAELKAALTAGAKSIILNADIEVTETIVVDYATVLNMNGKTLYNVDDLWEKNVGEWSIISVRTEDGDLTIIGDGTISAKENDCYAIDVQDGATLVIEDGTYVGNVSAVYICHGGNVTINGGDFSLLQLYPDERYMLNCLDADYVAGTATFTVTGGTFHGFNPADNASEGPHTNYVANGYVSIEDDGVWTVISNEIEITTFAELAAAIAAVNNGTYVNPTLIIKNDIAFEYELTISKSVYIMGDGEVKFIGYDASTKYDEAFYINVADEDQEITIDGIVFDHFCYYSNVANKTKATASAVKNADSYITYGGNCPASTTLYITGCQFIGTARDMISVDSTIGCKGYIVIEDCVFDATDRLSSTLNMLSFYGNEDAELSVLISGCTFKEATEQNATWATSAIASFGNADITVTGCEFIACQIAIAIDNTFDRLFSAVTYPVYHNTTVTLVDNTYTNCYYGYYEESVVASVDEIPEGAELSTDEPFTYGDEAATQFHFAAEYDLVVGGTQGVDAKYLVVACYYIAA